MPTEQLKESIVGWIAGLKETKDKSTGVWKWVVGLLLAAFAFLVVTYLSFRAFHQWRELARLRHNADVLKEDEHRAIVARENAAYAFEIEAYLEELEKIRQEIAHNDAEIEELNEKWELEKAKINAIENFDDLDLYVRSTSK